MRRSEMACVNKEPAITREDRHRRGDELGAGEGQKGEHCGRGKVNPRAARNGR